MPSNHGLIFTFDTEIYLISTFFFNNEKRPKLAFIFGKYNDAPLSCVNKTSLAVSEVNKWPLKLFVFIAQPCFESCSFNERSIFSCQKLGLKITATKRKINTEAIKR